MLKCIAVCPTSPEETLSRDAADSVLRDFKTYFVANTRRGNYVPTRPVGLAKAVINMVISDANKAFVVEHDGAIDALVAGLLVEKSHPRRTQEGGDELQATCALALQNLALSDVGKATLRCCSGSSRLGEHTARSRTSSQASHSKSRAQR